MKIEMNKKKKNEEMINDKWTDNEIGDSGARMISETLKTNTIDWTESELWWKLKWIKKKKNKEMINDKWTANNIGAEGARMISETLKTNTTLTKLDLGCDENWNE